MAFLPAELIKKKRENSALTEKEIGFFINGYTRGDIPDYQMSALLMAIFFRGMNETETLALTKCMLFSGKTVDFSGVPGFKVDGVGDKTSLILGPVVAACGIAVPMISGRGLGHTGGTLDKLESIPGFDIHFSLEKFVRSIRDHKICFIGQTPEICPADRKIYALRDVTATVESLPLICASILSKKLAEGVDGLVFDVKFGSGAFMKTAEDSERLARLLMDVARGYGKKVSALLTNMNQPLGRYAGNSLEVAECVDLLQNKRHPMTEDTRELSLRLSAQMLWMAGAAPSLEEAYRKCEESVLSGKAFEKFLELCRLHGGDLSRLPRAQKSLAITAAENGFVQSFDTEGIGYAGIQLKAGRARTEDKIDPVSGIEFHKKIGDAVQRGEPIFTLHGNDESLFAEAAKRLSTCVTYSLQKISAPVLIMKTLS
ncbi:MAG TPA: thymidine phosphorylase [Pseudobdellovibrionaceae bacterium]|nr:thymidine phosphorylase [Pseudobdellovibrionaceae bacterium]